ncbi:hypothetical protein HYW44_00630 [Candidatus Daviesbacteria bacterium]|nr:hypothetical protein [Candidatus Daviesbacteria bacterium]
MQGFRLNPILWATTFAYFAFYAVTASFIESLFPTIVFYFAVFSLIAGNFLYLYNYMIGSAKRGHWGLMKYVFLVPIYWLMASVASVIALYQLIVKPHYWEKTIHGLHLDKTTLKVKEKVKEVGEEIIPEITEEILGVPWHKKIRVALSTPKAFISSIAFIGASFIAGISNLLFNVYLGRVVSFESLGVVSLVGSFLYFSNIPQGALSSTVTHKIGFLEGRNRTPSALGFLTKTTKKALIISFILSGFWIASIPYLMRYFNTGNFLPFLLFTPVWTFGIGSALIRGFLSGKLLLTSVGAIVIAEAVTKFAVGYGLVTIGYGDFAFAAIPVSIVASMLFALVIAGRYLKVPAKIEASSKKDVKFPFGFFIASSLAILAPMAFLSLDVILAKHFLAPAEAGKYALVSIIGKIVFFLGALVSQLILPFVSRNEGANKASEKILLFVFIATFLVTGAGYIVWGYLAQFSVPLVFGAKAFPIIPYLEPFTFAMICFSLSQIFVGFYLAKKVYTFPAAAFLLAIVQYFFISYYHSNVEAIVMGMFLLALLNLIVMSCLHFLVEYVKVFENNLKDFFGLFTRALPFDPQPGKKLRVLIYNWRDIKHIWAGGAENYLHELSRLWVGKGYQR